MASDVIGPQTQIRAVIFDFGGVLCFHPSPEQIARAANAAGVPAERFESALWTDRVEYDAGRIEPEAYWRKVGDLAGAQTGSALQALLNMDVELWNRFDDRVLAWIRLLRERGISIAILSNLPRPLGESLRSRPGFLKHFDHITFSYELGLVKPQREIYDHAVWGLGVNPDETLFLDDRRPNIEGATEAGLHALLYRNWEDFLASDPAARYGLPEPAGVGPTARRQ